MKNNKQTSRLVLAFQLVVNAIQITLHHFAPDLLLTNHQRLTVLSKFLIYAGGFAAIVVLGMVGGQLQMRTKPYEPYVDLGVTGSQSPERGEPKRMDQNTGKFEGVLSIVISVAVWFLTAYLVQ